MPMYDPQLVRQYQALGGGAPPPRPVPQYQQTPQQFPMAQQGALAAQRGMQTAQGINDPNRVQQRRAVPQSGGNSGGMLGGAMGGMMSGMMSDRRAKILEDENARLNAELDRVATDASSEMDRAFSPENQPGARPSRAQVPERDQDYELDQVERDASARMREAFQPPGYIDPNSERARELAIMAQPVRGGGDEAARRQQLILDLKRAEQLGALSEQDYQREQGALGSDRRMKRY